MISFFPPFLVFFNCFRLGLKRLLNLTYGGCIHRSCDFHFFFSPKEKLVFRASANPIYKQKVKRQKVGLSRFLGGINGGCKSSLLLAFSILLNLVPETSANLLSTIVKCAHEDYFRTKILRRDCIVYLQELKKKNKTAHKTSDSSRSCVSVERYFTF
jgi:hypothetical protein